MKMVSTRGVKIKFHEGEKVLCYEPDPSKAKVLYESKVLETGVTKDKRGKKVAEYLIHFNGWNSSWDRFVLEEFILKDCPENRALQKRLAQEAAIKLKNKKKRQRLADLLKVSIDEKKLKLRANCRRGMAESSETSSSESSSSSSSDEECQENGVVDAKANVVPTVMASALSLPEKLKKQLEADCCLINKKKKLVKLPSEPSVICILERYVRYFAKQMLINTQKSTQAKGCNASLSICKEVVDGLRIYFDFTLPHLLLYNVEKQQHEHVMRRFKAKQFVKSESTETVSSKSPTESVPAQNSNVPLSPSPDTNTHSRTCESQKASDCIAASKQNLKSIKKEKTECGASDGSSNAHPQQRVLRSCSAVLQPYPEANVPTQSVLPAELSQPEADDKLASCPVVENGKLTQTNGTCKLPEPGPGHRLEGPLTPTTIKYEASVVSSRSCHSSAGATAEYWNSVLSGDLSSWRLIPPEAQADDAPAPSVMYGAPHLLRLFVKLPDLLCSASISRQRSRVLAHHLQMFIKYLEDQLGDLFPESAYVDCEDDPSHQESSAVR